MKKITKNTMNYFVYIYCSLHLGAISITGASVIGTFGCDCFGELPEQCNITVPIESYPEECTSYLYDGIMISESYTVNDPTLQGSVRKGYLNKLLDTGKNVILYCGRGSQRDWIYALLIDKTTGEIFAKRDMISLQGYFDSHKGIKGIAFYNFDMYVNIIPFANFTQNLKIYLDMVKSSFPDLEVGISLEGRQTINYYTNPKVKWLNFTTLDPSIDFYIVSLNNLNDCTAQFTHDGIYPLTGDNNNNTVDMVRTYLEKAGIPRSKLYYKYLVHAFPMDLTTPYCESYYTSFCVDPKDAKTALCADTIQSLTEKGKYAKDNGAGFVMNTIDLDDFDGCSCQCGRTYPGFHALVDGYNGAPPPPPCARFDRS